MPLLNDVAGLTNSGNGAFDASHGMLVYFSTQSMPAKWPVTWVDATGRQEPIPLPAARYFAPRISPDGGKLAIAAAPLATGSDIDVYDFRRDTITRLTFTGNNSKSLCAGWEAHCLRIDITAGTRRPLGTCGWVRRKENVTGEQDRTSTRQLLP